MLVLSRKVDESIAIGEGDKQIIVRVIRIAGGAVRIGIIAPRDVQVRRTELKPKTPTPGVDTIVASSATDAIPVS